jgi:hypothetical protein
MMRTILIGIALGVGCVTSAQSLVLADKQQCDALTVCVRLFQNLVTWVGAAAFLIDIVI